MRKLEDLSPLVVTVKTTIIQELWAYCGLVGVLDYKKQKFWSTRHGPRPANVAGTTTQEPARVTETVKRRREDA